MTIEATQNGFTLDEILAISLGEKVKLCGDPQWIAGINHTREMVDAAWQSGANIYGITTGFGDSVDQSVSVENARLLQRNLAAFHGCGLGEFFTPRQSRAILAVRLASLLHGMSGVRLELLQRIVELLNHDISPLIPSEGSVGASGDLTPMSYCAAVIWGDREVIYKNKKMSSAEAHRLAGLTPLEPMPKESLSIMNGTSVMTALCVEAIERSKQIRGVARVVTAMMIMALRGNRFHFDPRIFAAKPFDGSAQDAHKIASLCTVDTDAHNRLQNQYSLRCAPHIIGVLSDALPQMCAWVETEMNGANDNPLIDPVTGEFLHGGNFYGGHMAFVADGLKNAVANIADLLDRQIALATDTKTNNGLAPNLRGIEGSGSHAHHGLKALAIAVSAWTAEALKLTMPASVFSRSTECHNQDKVSMGTIAARDALRVCTLTEQVAAGVLFAAAQALHLRIRSGEIEKNILAPQVLNVFQVVENAGGLLVEDRPLDATLTVLCQAIRNGLLQD